jgi:hypothetical protein
MPRHSRSASKAIYQLKVTLKHIQPPVWRRLLVAADIRLDTLHSVFQVAMGWTNSHLHQFSLRDRHFGDTQSTRTPSPGPAATSTRRASASTP